MTIPADRPIDERPAATPYMSCKGAAAALEFYEKAFEAVELQRFMMPDGRVGHAEITIAGALVMLADEFPDIGFLSPQTLGGSPVMIHVYVKDVDAVFARAVEAGATATRPVKDEDHGDRVGQIRDPFGHVWMLASRLPASGSKASR